MINIQVDEAYAFDYLAILDVKWMEGRKDTVEKCHNFKLVNDQSLFIMDQVGQDKYYQVTRSKEYAELICLHTTLYRLIDHIRNPNENILARDADNLNIERYHLKKKIQEKFFKSELTEVKTCI